MSTQIAQTITIAPDEDYEEYEEEAHVFFWYSNEEGYEVEWVVSEDGYKHSWSSLSAYIKMQVYAGLEAKRECTKAYPEMTPEYCLKCFK